MLQSAVRVLFSVVLTLSLAALPAHGQPTGPQACAGLFFSEYIEGSSNNKALEVFNGTGVAVDLAAEGYRVEFYFNGSATPGAIIPFAGVVANGDVYVLADDDAAPAILAVANQTDAANFFNGNDAVALKRGSTIVDVIGQVAFDPGAAWGSGMTSTVDHTLRRKASVSAGDANPNDPFEPALQWDGYARDTFAGLGTHTATCFAPPVEVMINELDSDTPGTDVLEFIELYDGGAGNAPLDGLVVVFYNGGPDTSYAAFDLDGYQTDAAGYFVLGNAAVSPTPGLIFPNGLLQNGADAVALYRADASAFPNGTPVTDDSQPAGRPGLRHRRRGRPRPAGAAQPGPAAGQRKRGRQSGRSVHRPLPQRGGRFAQQRDLPPQRAFARHCQQLRRERRQLRRFSDVDPHHPGQRPGQPVGGNAAGCGGAGGGRLPELTERLRRVLPAGGCRRYGR